MSNDNNTIIPDDIISTINDFKRSKNGSMISIHGKEYATVAHRIAVVRRNLGAKLQILTEIISVDKDTVVMKASGLIGEDALRGSIAHLLGPIQLYLLKHKKLKTVKQLKV